MPNADKHVLDQIQKARKGDKKALGFLRKVATAADPAANPGELRRRGLLPVKLRVETRAELRALMTDNGIVTSGSLTRV
jgi:hypothetical protein